MKRNLILGAWKRVARRHKNKRELGDVAMVVFLDAVSQTMEQYEKIFDRQVLAVTQMQTDFREAQAEMVKNVKRRQKP
jgi:hypothetical protein